MMEILGALTSVYLVTANLPEDSAIRRNFDFVNLTDRREVDSIPRAAWEFVVNQVKMAREVAGRDEDVALFYGATSYLLPTLAAKLSSKTIVVLPRADVPLDLKLRWQERVPRFVAWFFASLVAVLERTCYRIADAVVAYSPGMADELGLRRYEHKLYTSGARYVDTDEFHPKTPYDERRTLVGYLGRIERNKGVEELAEAAKLLSTDVDFLFAGDGRMLDWLESEMEEEVEEGAVDLRGWVDHEDVPDVLSEMKLLVMPSEPTEGLPTVILEALACGTPVYASPVSGVPDVVKEGETGWLMHDRSPHMIAGEIGQILDEDLEEVSDRARKLAVEEYSFDAAVERYRRILTQL